MLEPQRDMKVFENDLAVETTVIRKYREQGIIRELASSQDASFRRVRFKAR